MSFVDEKKVFSKSGEIQVNREEETPAKNQQQIHLQGNTGVRSEGGCPYLQEAEDKETASSTELRTKPGQYFIKSRL